MEKARLAGLIRPSGSCRFVGTTLLRDLAAAGPNVRWMHVPSHVGIVGNTSADTLADMAPDHIFDFLVAMIHFAL